MDEEGKKIEWRYILALHDLQEKEGLRAANKLKKGHVFFEKTKMKVHLATQLLSRYSRKQDNDGKLTTFIFLFFFQISGQCHRACRA